MQEKPVPRQAEGSFLGSVTSVMARYCTEHSTCPSAPGKGGRCRDPLPCACAMGAPGSPTRPCGSLSPGTRVAPQGGGAALEPPICSGLLFPGRQSNFGSCSLQLVFLLGDSLGAASAQNLEELGRGTAWGEEGQDWLHQPRCSVQD